MIFLVFSSLEIIDEKKIDFSSCSKNLACHPYESISLNYFWFSLEYLRIDGSWIYGAVWRWCCRCKMYPDMSYSEKTTTETLIVGVAPQKTYVLFCFSFIFFFHAEKNGVFLPPRWGGSTLYNLLKIINYSRQIMMLCCHNFGSCRYFEGSEMTVGAEDGGCKCGDNCTCDPCNCKWERY